MKTVQAVFEQGVFRPVGDVGLPEKTEVEFEPRVVEVQRGNAMLEAIEIFAMHEAFEILSHSYETGETDLAAQHDEHR